MTNLRVSNVRFLNLKNGKNAGTNKMNVLEQFCLKNGTAEKKESWRIDIETEIEKKATEVEELRKKRKQAKSKKRTLELFKECEVRLKSMFVDWKETPKKEEEQKFEQLKEKILMKKKKTEEDEEQKTTIHQSADLADQAVQIVATTMKGKPGNSISRKLQPSEVAKVSGLDTKLTIITKPQQDYGSVGIRNQIVTDCTGNSTNGKGVWDEREPPRQ